MAFKTDGSSHKNGVNLEEKTIDILGSNKKLQRAVCGEFEFRNAEKVGGTRFLEDIRVDTTSGPIGLSVKRRKGKSGTFDWANTSKLAKVLLNENHDLSALMHNLKGKYKHTPRNVLIKKKYEKELDNHFSEAVQSLSHQSIKSMLSYVVGKYTDINMNMKVCVYREFSSQYVVYDFEDIWWTDLMNCEGSFFTKGKPNSKSRVIWFRHADGQEVNTHLRIRVGLNNGVSALLGGKDWSSNSTSQVVVKIQQDKTDSIVPVSAKVVDMQ